MGHGVHFLSVGESILWSLIILGILGVFAVLALNKKTLGVPDRLQNIAEVIVEFLLGIFEPELGKDMMPLVLPFLGTFFLFIIISNIFLLIPYAQCPTGDISTTVAIAIISILGVHILSIKIKGPKKYLWDWINPYPELFEKSTDEGEKESTDEGKENSTVEREEEKAGFFKKISGHPYFSMMIIIVSLLILLYWNGASLSSFSSRLFGNIFGENTAFPTLILILDVLVATIQIIVFCILGIFYLKNTDEAIAEFLFGLFDPESRKDLIPLLLPFLGMFFLFIIIPNIFFIISYTQYHTGDLSTTVAVAILSVLGIYFLSTKIKALKKYLMDWINPYLELFQKISGLLYTSMMIIIVSLLILLHGMDNGARLLSLSFRLFGNIFGEHTVYSMVSQVALGSYRMVIPLFIPLVILILDILVAIIQATVFCMLSTFYLKEEAAIHH